MNNITACTLPKRFWAKVDRESTPDGCWLWTGHKLPNGYGRINDGRSGYAHRAAWEIENGPIPDGLTIDHLCNVKACVRIDHLKLATQQENILRGNNMAARNVRKTECINGHSLANAYIHMRKGSPQRTCRTCVKLRGQAYRARRARSRAATADVAGTRALIALADLTTAVE